MPRDVTRHKRCRSKVNLENGILTGPYRAKDRMELYINSTLVGKFLIHGRGVGSTH